MSGFKKWIIAKNRYSCLPHSGIKQSTDEKKWPTQKMAYHWSKSMYLCGFSFDMYLQSYYENERFSYVCSQTFHTDIRVHSKTT